MYKSYRIIVGLLFALALPFLLLLVLVTGKHRRGLAQRFGYGGVLPKKGDMPRIWLHAASVGEVQAAIQLVTALRRELGSFQLILTTMTIHGRDFARGQLDDATCLLAPLDIPFITARALRRINPDIYICLETELWPVILADLKERGVPLLLANGRMSDRSADRYYRYRRFFEQVLANFSAFCVVSEADRDRFRVIGAAEDRLQVTGNLKYDRVLPADPERLRSHYRQLLGVTAEHEIFVAGSTHGGEEEQLLPLLDDQESEGRLLLFIAPRHLTRVSEVTELLARRGVGHNLLSMLKAGGQRTERVVLIDSYGDLAGLYGLADYIFCGGSLVDRRGHNIMEAAIWARPVMYGPSMADFLDAVEQLEQGGGGFMVTSGEDILRRIRSFRTKPDLYRKACLSAGRVSSLNQGAAARQADLVRRLLTGETTGAVLAEPPGSPSS